MCGRARITQQTKGARGLQNGAKTHSRFTRSFVTRQFADYTETRQPHLSVHHLSSYKTIYIILALRRHLLPSFLFYLSMYTQMHDPSTCSVSLSKWSEVLKNKFIHDHHMIYLLSIMDGWYSEGSFNLYSNLFALHLHFTDQSLLLLRSNYVGPIFQVFLFPLH